MEDLGALSEEPGSTNGSWGTAINTLGQVTGVSLEYGGQRASAFRWTPSGGMQPVGADGRWAVAVAINDLGEVAGDDQPRSYSCASHAFRWTESGGTQDLGTLGKSTYCNATGSHASSMNAIGQVVGDYDDLGPGGSGATRAMRWTESSGMQDLGRLGGTNSHATAINARGQITGDADTAHGETHAFRWNPMFRWSP